MREVGGREDGRRTAGRRLLVIGHWEPRRAEGLNLAILEGQDLALEPDLDAELVVGGHQSLRLGGWSPRAIADMSKHGKRPAKIVGLVEARSGKERVLDAIPCERF